VTVESRQKKWILLAVKLLIVAIVFWWVHNTLVKAWGQISQHEWQLAPGWLLASGLLYLVGLLPAGLFWHRVLHALGQDAGLFETLRAYYVGHLGKYVPGKAMVVIIRAGMVRSHRVDTVAAAVSVAYETLSMMAVGACLSALLLAIGFREQRMLFWGSLAMMAVAGLPIFPPIFRLLVRLLGVIKPGGAWDQASTEVGRIGFRTMFLGGGLMTVTWCLLGLSLWATFRGIGIQGLDPIRYFASYTCSVSVATVAGILSLIPGGFGVREMVLVELLVQLFGQINSGQAAVASGMLRLVSLLSELGISGILYWIVPRRQASPTKQDTP
jgi:uncharacterized membrane protein YbhN (UPF0104 family)